ncbi:hypothetical protein PPTS312_44050 [Pseudomonas putida]|uniref:HEPN domain-containing protein n=1 Tax=Pseudomonas putida TaxID=303 RepID=A0A7U6M5U8_PSEPU|nr:MULTISPECIES: hypothetical protein [Pseudomonas putida group]MDD2125680.1 hypothetical protein [Pseudomonas monteilii]BBU46490.1 hypothetical protein PPTS312_44050 [Pseudomonas putida]
MSGIKLPTESWLEGVNETLAKEGLIPERRPIEAFRRWCIESQQSLAFGAEATKVIGEWFSRNTTYGLHVRQPFGRAAFYWDMAFVEVVMPVVYGRPHISPLEQFRNVPPYLVQRLVSSSESLEAYEQHFSNAYGVFVMEENIRRLEEASPSAVGQFVLAASRQLTSATAALLSSPPSAKALEDSRLAVEISIKAVLVLMLGHTDATLQKQFSHRLVPLRTELLKVTPDPGFTEAELAIYPEVSARYGDLPDDRANLWKGYELALRVVAMSFEIIQSELLARQ